MQITVHLLKPSKDTVITYVGEVLQRSATHMVIHATWPSTEPKDLGYVTFAPGDIFYEHYYTDRWYNIFEVHRASGELKGWYCNVTRPAVFHEAEIDSEDLELDLFVPPDRQKLLVLDEDEFDARSFDTTDPATYTAALAALDELRALVQRCEEPFDKGEHLPESD